MGRYSLATLFGVGLLKKGPGTAGSAVAALLAYFVFGLPFGWHLLLLGTIFFTIHGTRSANRYMAGTGSEHDPKEIVIDELAGQWLTYVLLLAFTRGLDCVNGACSFNFSSLATLPFSVQLLPAFILIGFIFFRAFDILKPWPISWADRKVKGGFGVMFDDLLAAIPAAVVATMLFPFAAMFLYAWTK